MRTAVDELRSALSRIPHLGIPALPTPLERAPRLASAIGGAALHVKRDDLTGLAFGGNKTRQLDIILADATRRGATAIVSEAGPQSNQARQLAAAAARLGLELRFVIAGAPPQFASANDLLCEILGARVDYVDTKADLADAIARISGDLESAGRKPHVLDVLDHRTEDSCLGAVAYMEAACEILEQLPSGPTHVFVSCGTGSSPTLAGLAAGFAAAGSAARLVGVPASPQPPLVTEQTRDIAVRALARLGLTGDPKITIENEFAGLAYGATAESVAAVRLAARTEGLLCDPNYTGKTLAAIAADARRRKSDDDVTVFVHTGGLPLLFQPELAEVLIDR